jgi:phage terminase large subunit-like protein
MKTAKPRRVKAARKRQGDAKAKRERAETRELGEVWDGRKNNGKNLEPWRFKLGNNANPDGRPKTARRMLNEAFIADLQEAWKVSGKTVIEDAIKKYPDVFLYANAALVPRELRFKIKGLVDKDAVFGARMLAACADVKPLRTTLHEEAKVDAELGPEWNTLALYKPYKKQMDFHAKGAIHDERLLMAGNQLGKTLAGAMEWAMHLTGRYPDWWTGKVFDAPVRLWATGVTAESTRDNPQRVLMGLPQMKETWGTGTIPKDAIKDWRLGYHLGDALDSVVVRWGGGGDVAMGESVLSFKSYEKGREKWQGETLDGVWFDEEPPLDIYCEGRTRCVAKRGIVMVTFTPLQGMSEVVKLFLSEADVARIRELAA